MFKVTLIGGTSNSFLKIYCLLRNCNLQYSFHILDDSTITLSKFAIGLLYFALLPIGFAIVSFPIFFLLRLINVSKFGTVYKNYWITTSLVFTTLLYPTIITYTFGLFSCFNVNGIYYLIGDTTI